MFFISAQLDEYIRQTTANLILPVLVRDKFAQNLPIGRDRFRYFLQLILIAYQPSKTNFSCRNCIIYNAMCDLLFRYTSLVYERLKRKFPQSALERENRYQLVE